MFFPPETGLETGIQLRCKMQLGKGSNLFRHCRAKNCCAIIATHSVLRSNFSVVFLILDVESTSEATGTEHRRKIQEEER